MRSAGPLGVVPPPPPEPLPAEIASAILKRCEGGGRHCPFHFGSGGPRVVLGQRFPGAMIAALWTDGGWGRRPPDAAPLLYADGGFVLTGKGTDPDRERFHVETIRRVLLEYAAAMGITGKAERGA